MRYTLIVGKPRNPGASGVYEVMREWASAGLVQESFWLDVEDATHLLQISAEGEAKHETEKWVSAKLSADDEINVYVIQPLRDPDSVVTYAEASSLLAKFGGLNVTAGKLVNVLVPVDQQGDLPVSPTFESNVNYIAEPVDGFSPTGGSVAIGKRSAQYSQHAAKELASVAGIWPGQSEPGIANRQLSIGRDASYVVGRSFVRYVDASSLVASVTEQVLKVDSTKLPTPVSADQNAQLEVIPEGEARDQVNIAVDSFFETHKQKLSFNRPKRQLEVRPDEKGLIAMFLDYWKWVFRWFARKFFELITGKINDIKRDIASRAQGLYGYDAKVAVFVGGVSVHNDANGKTIAMPELIIKEAERQVSEANRSAKPEPENPEDLWLHFVEVATSLVDGGPLSPSNAVDLPQYIGGARRVITNPAFIAPDIAGRPFAVPAHLSIPYAGEQLHTDDPLTAKMMLDKFNAIVLNPAGVNPSEVTAIAKLKYELEAWIETNNSFVWKVGQRLSANIHTALEFWKAFAGKLGGSTVEEDEWRAADETATKAFKRMFKGGMGILGAALMVWLGQALFLFFTTGAWPMISGVWWIPALIVGGVVLLWNIVGGIMLKSELRALHIIEQKMSTAEAELEFAKAVRMDLWQEVFRLSSLYKQYQDWSSVISPFIHRERAKSDDLSAAQKPLGILPALPAAMAIARLTPDDNSAKDLMQTVQSGFYKQGWLLRAVMRSVEEAGFKPSVWRDTRRSDASELAGLATKAKSSEIHEIIRRGSTSIIEELAANGDAYQKWSIKLVDAVGETNVANGIEFIAALGQGGRNLPESSVFSGSGSVADASAIDPRASICDFDGNVDVSCDVTKRTGIKASASSARRLDFMAVRLELTAQLPASHIAITAEKTTKKAEAPTESVILPDAPEA